MASLEPSGNSIYHEDKSIYVAKELQVERERSKLHLEELTHLIDGGKECTDKRRRMEKLVLSDPVFRQDDSYFLGYDESFDSLMKKTTHFAELVRKNNIVDRKELVYVRRTINEGLTLILHLEMFIPTIESQGTEEQKAKWLPLARNFTITGSYAQTELGHGTYIRGLETTATYDPQTEEFVLHSPTLTSMKWWPGGLGHMATHAIVVAQLVIGEQNHGIHPFMVQIRSLHDHKPFPGVEVGDIGPKFGYSESDHGFLRLTNVRIPRDQMLMKYSHVAADGTYLKPPVDRIAYGSMVMIRAGLVSTVACSLAKAVTIATRYSVVRRQMQSKPGEEETQVMDYQTQQFKLLPLLATAYAMTLAGETLSRMYFQFTQEAAEGRFDSLPELHATCAGLKAFSTEVCSNGIELCRLCCGGHGYSLASGLPTLYVRDTAAQTYEGENSVMLLQTGRYLHKILNQRLSMAELPSNVVYLAADFPTHGSSPVREPSQFDKPSVLLRAYQRRARSCVEIASHRYQEGIRSKLDPLKAWNSSGVDWVTAARAHCHLAVLKLFQDALQSSDLSASNRSILNCLFTLYGVFGIVQFAGEFALDGYLSNEQIAMARTHLYHLLKIVRREAVPLVDAFDIRDEVLNSALGRYDGDVYTHLYQWALKAPRNKDEVHEVYHKYIRKLLKSKM